jgi:DNA replication protein DnaC
MDAAERHMDRLHSYFEHSGIPPRLHGMTLTTLRCAAEAAAGGAGGGAGEDPLEGKSAAIDAAEKLAGGQRHQGRNGMLLRGPNGVGKTGLLVCLARGSFERGWVPLFVKYTDFVQSVQAGYGKPVNGPSGGTVNMELADFLIRVGQTAPLLVLDDIGDPFAREDRFQETEDRRRILFQLLAARHETSRPTHLSANFRTRRELAEQIGPRIADRMREMCAEVQMAGANLRDAS